MGLKEGGARGSLRNVSVNTSISTVNLSHDYDAFEEATGALTTWTDQAGSADLSAGGDPQVVSDGINSNQSVSFDNTDDNATGSTVSTWNFLHDGSAFSLYVVVELANSGEFRNIIATTSGGGLSSSTTGFILARDDRSGSGFDNALRVGVSDGSSFVIQSDNGSVFPTGSPEIFVVRFDGTDQYTIDRGKTTLASPTGTGHTTNDADEPVRVGDGGSTSPLGGDVGRCLYYNVEHDDVTRDNTVDVLADQFDITI
jgi:hypothetical protein